MRFFRLLLLTVALATVPVVGEAAEKPKLFKAYWYGQPMEEIRRDPAIYTYGGASGTAVAAMDIEFLGADTQVIFNPSEQGDWLHSVMLFQEWDSDQFSRMKRELDDSFLPVYAESSGTLLDYVRIGSGARSAAERLDFENTAIRNGSLVLFFVERSAITNIKQIRSADDVVLDEESGARLAFLMVRDGRIILSFQRSSDETGGAEDF